MNYIVLNSLKDFIKLYHAIVFQKGYVYNIFKQEMLDY